MTYVYLITFFLYICLLIYLALYHQSLLGAHNTLGFSSNPLVKRPRFEATTSLLPVYPQRPGEKDCAHYMLTRTCKFGDSCKFDHPMWVPEGGIPDWKEVTFYRYFHYIYLSNYTYINYKQTIFCVYNVFIFLIQCCMLLLYLHMFTLYYLIFIC